MAPQLIITTLQQLRSGGVINFYIAGIHASPAETDRIRRHHQDRIITFRKFLRVVVQLVVAKPTNETKVTLE